MQTAIRIAVTGALGNVGSIAVRHLRERGHDVVEIDRAQGGLSQDPSFIPADLTSFDETIGALRGADVVVHLAGINSPISDPGWKVHNNNVTASYNVLSAAVELGITRVVQSSSVNAIGLAWSRSPEFDYFPIDTLHRSRVEDPYSLSKVFQELQADSLARRYETFSAVSLRLHAVIRDAEEGRELRRRLGESWAINGLFGYCTYESVVSAIELSCFAPVEGHEVLLVVEPETFALEPSAELAETYFHDVPVRSPLTGHSGFFDTTLTRRILGWRPSTDLA
jgi:UDP-glucose 4-epimerase